MDGFSGQNNDHVALNIDQEELNSMKEKLREEPKLLKKSAAKECCIFRVPRSLVQINPEAYLPQIVSIGPYHQRSKNKDLKKVQQHKWRFLNEFLARSPEKNLEFYFKLVLSMDSEIRESYSESIDQFSKNELAQIMVLDGFFIIELFRKFGQVTGFNNDDLFFTMSWVSLFLRRDLLRLENQIPFKVLQKLFDESKDTCTTSSAPNKTFAKLILEFFNFTMDRTEEELQEYGQECKHLLDFSRKSFISKNRNDQRPTQEHPFLKDLMLKDPKLNLSKIEKDLKLIPCATKLQVAGVKFKENPKTSSFLDIKFDKGLLEIPQISMGDFFSSFLLNCVVFEQCYCHCSRDFTTYTTFMNFLINTPADASLLSDKNIIKNYLGSDKNLFEFFQKMGKDVSFIIINNYLVPVIWTVNEYYGNGWHVEWARFKHTYFESPWSFISALVAFMLLSLTFIQSFFTIFAYYHPRN